MIEDKKYDLEQEVDKKDYTVRKTIPKHQTSNMNFIPDALKL